MSNTPWTNGLTLDESIVIRNGGSNRTSDELKVCFIEDAIFLISSTYDRVDAADLDASKGVEFRQAIYDSLRKQALHPQEHQWTVEEAPGGPALSRTGMVEMLTTLREWLQELNDELELGRDEISGNAWFRYTNDGDYVNDEMTDPEEMVRDMEAVLSGIGFCTIWDDGFRIEPAHPEDCRGCGMSAQDEHEYEPGLEWRDFDMKDLNGTMLNHRIRNGAGDEPLGTIVGIEHKIVGDGRAIRDLWVTVKVQAPGELLTFHNPMYGGKVQVEVEIDEED